MLFLQNVDDTCYTLFLVLTALALNSVSTNLMSQNRSKDRNALSTLFHWRCIKSTGSQSFCQHHIELGNYQTEAGIFWGDFEDLRRCADLFCKTVAIFTCTIKTNVKLEDHFATLKLHVVHQNRTTSLMSWYHLILSEKQYKFKIAEGRCTRYWNFFKDKILKRDFHKTVLLVYTPRSLFYI